MRIICVKNNFVIKFLYGRKFKVLQCWENSYNLVDFQRCWENSYNLVDFQSSCQLLQSQVYSNGLEQRILKSKLKFVLTNEEE